MLDIARKGIYCMKTHFFFILTILSCFVSGFFFLNFHGKLILDNILTIVDAKRITRYTKISKSKGFGVHP